MLRRPLVRDKRLKCWNYVLYDQQTYDELMQTGQIGNERWKL